VRKRTRKKKRRTVVENKKTRGEGRTAEQQKHTKNWNEGKEEKRGGAKGEESGER
jgi:hypothetical protein